MKFNKKVQSEFLIKNLVQVRRVCKVVEGGTNFSFSALVVVGDGRGNSAIAIASAKELPDAIKKAFERASNKNFDFCPLKQGRTVHSKVTAKYCASKVMVKPAPKGAGMKVGKTLALYCQAIGIKDVTIKTFGSRNPINVLKSLREALLSIETERHKLIKRNLIDPSVDKKPSVDQKSGAKLESDKDQKSLEGGFESKKAGTMGSRKPLRNRNETASVST